MQGKSILNNAFKISDIRMYDDKWYKSLDFTDLVRLA